MKTLIASMLLLAACDDSMSNYAAEGSPVVVAGTCDRPRGSVLAFQDCGKQMADGTACITGCWVKPIDGEFTEVAPGCQEDISTSDLRTGTCVESCGVCP